MNNDSRYYRVISSGLGAFSDSFVNIDGFSANGIQRYVGDTTPTGDPNAAIDLRFSVLNGEYTYISG